MRIGECSFLFISAIKAFNSASCQKSLHQAMAFLNDLMTVASKNDIAVTFTNDDDGYIRKLSIGIKGKATYHYTINDESITAGLKGEYSCPT